MTPFDQLRERTVELEKKYSLPEGMLWKVAGIESGHQANAQGPVTKSGERASGWFQFMPATAKQYGVADPTDFNQASDGAARMLRDLMGKYNGDVNKTLAYYNGGGGAVKALDKGNPWPETADYLAKFHGSNQLDSPLSKPGPAPVVNAGVAVGLGNRGAEGLKQAQDSLTHDGVINSTIGFGKGVAAGLENTTLFAMYQRKAMEKFDPNYAPTKDLYDQALKDVPQEYWDKVTSGAGSAEELLARGEWIRGVLKDTQDAAAYGGAGKAGVMVGNMLDVDTMAALLTPNKWAVANMFSKTSRLVRGIESGLVAAAGNAAFEAATYQMKPLDTVDDIKWSAAMGLGLAGPLGALQKNPPKLGDLPQAPGRLDLENNALAARARLETERLRTAEFDKMLSESGQAYKAKIESDIEKWQKGFYRELERDTALYINKNFPGRSVPDSLPIGKGLDLPAADLFHRGQGAPSSSPHNQWFDNWASTRMDTESEVFRFLQGGGASKITYAADGSIARVDGGGKVGPTDLRRVGVTNKAEVDRLHGLLNGPMKDPKKASELIQYANRTSAKSVMDEIIAKDKDPMRRELAKFLKERMRTDVDVHWVPDADWGKHRNTNVLGYYSSIRHAVFMPEKNRANYGTALHEILHVATVHKLDYGLANPHTEIGKLTKELDDLLTIARREASKRGMRNNYYLTNIKEFTAGLYSGKDGGWSTDFIKLLSDIKVENKPLLHKVVDVIRQLLGFGPKETNALLRSLDLLSELVDKRLDVKLSRPGGDTDIHLNVAHDFVDPVDAQAANKAGVGEVFGWGLGLENSLGKASMPAQVRDLASKLFGTTIGYKDHAVVRRNAWDSTVQLSESWHTKLMKPIDPLFRDYMEANKVKMLDRAKAWENFSKEVGEVVLGIRTDAHPSVMSAAKHYQNLMAEVVDHINNPGLHTGEVKRGLTQREYTDPVTGEKKISPPLEKNPRYTPRVPDVQKWNHLVSQFGRDAVEGFFANSFAKATGAPLERAQRFGKWYVHAVEEAKVNRSYELLDDMLKGQDRQALKTSLMNNLGLDEFEAQKLIDDMFPLHTTDASAPTGSLKHRNSLDETHTETWMDRNGNSVEIGYGDLFDTNVFDVAKGYLRRTAGAVSLANHLDVYKSTDIDALIAAATKNELGSAFTSEKQLTKMRKDLQFAFDRIMAVPQEDFTGLNKSLSMWRSFNVIRLMGGAVFNQLVEAAQITGSLGLRTTLNAVPELSKLRRDIASGKAPTDLLDHLENTIGGAGADFIKRLDFAEKDDWVRKLGDNKWNRRLDKVDTGLQKMAKGVLDYTGMTGLMVQQKRLHATALVNHWVNVAHGAESTLLTPNRLAMMGLDDAGFASVKEALVKYSKDAKGSFKDTKQINFDLWQREDPKTHADFMLAIQRESRRVVQENDLASMVPIMGSTLGQTVFQFQNFTFQAWNKALMYGVHHRDINTTMTILHGGLIGSLVYMGRTAANGVGMSPEDQDKYFEQRMSFGQVMANGFGRISQASLLPTMYDTTIGTMTGTPMFSGMRTTSDLSSFASNPTLSAVNSVISMQKLVRNAISDEYQTTSRDVRTWGRAVLPFNSIPPISTILNAVSAEFPYSDKQLSD